MPKLQAVSGRRCEKIGFGLEDIHRVLDRLKARY